MEKYVLRYRKKGYTQSQLLVVDDAKLAWEMARSAGVPIAFAGWGRTDFPEITGEMTRLCDFSFTSTKDLEHFLFINIYKLIFYY